MIFINILIFWYYTTFQCRKKTFFWFVIYVYMSNHNTWTPWPICKSVIVIVTWRVNWNYVNSPFHIPLWYSVVVKPCRIKYLFTSIYSQWISRAFRIYDSQWHGNSSTWKLIRLCQVFAILSPCPAFWSAIKDIWLLHLQIKPFSNNLNIIK